MVLTAVLTEPARLARDPVGEPESRSTGVGWAAEERLEFDRGTCARRTPPGRGSAGSLAVMIRTLHLEAWAGLWVAVDHEDRVVASAPTVKDLMATLDGEGIEDVEIMRAPDPNEAIPYGLG